MTAKPSKRIGKKRVAVAAILTLALLSVLVPAAVSTADGQTGPYVTFYTVTAPESSESSELPDIKFAAVPTPYCKLETAGGRVADPGIPPGPGIDKGYGAFIGWYTAPQGAADAKRFDFSANRTGDASAFAHFRTDVLASFLDGNGNVFLTKSVPIGGKISAPDKNEMAIFSGGVGQVFSHWAVEGEPNEAAYVFDTARSDDIVLKPVFSQETSHYVFFYSEGTQVPFTTVADSGTVPKPADPSRAGYDFAGWTKDRAGETPFDFANETIYANTILYAQWTGLPVGYTVMLWNEKSGISAGTSFDPGDYEYYGQSVGHTAKAGTDLTSVTNKAVADGFADAIAAAVASAQAAKKNDATDKIHFLDTEGYVIRSSSSAVLGDGGTIVNVYFPRKEYTIAFDLDRAGGEMTIAGRTYASGGDTYEIRAKLGQNVADVWPIRPAATFNKLGAYAFQGWLAKGDPVVYSSKQLVLGGAIASTADASGRIVLTGKWIDNGKSVNINYMFEALPGEPTDATLNGVRYARSAEYSQEVLSPATGAYNAKHIEGYTAVYPTARRQSGAGYVPITGTAPAEQYLFYTREKFKLIFIGGQSDPGVSSGVYTLALRSDLDYDRISYGTALSAYAPGSPARENADGKSYIFEGWYLDAGLTMPFYFGAAHMPPVDLPLFAKWRVSQYKIRVYDRVGAETPILTLDRAKDERVGDLGREEELKDYVSNGQNSRVPGHEKQVFTGWSVAVGPGAYMPLSPEIPVTGDMDVYASWVPPTVTYKVTYARGGASDTWSLPTDDRNYAGFTFAVAKGAVGDTDTVAGVGKTFVGWATENGGAVVYYPGQEMEITGDVTLRPVFVDSSAAAKVSLTYDANFVTGGISGTEQEPAGRVENDHVPNDVVTVKSYRQAFGENAKDPKGYMFYGWTTTSENATSSGARVYGSGEEIPLTTSTTLYAQYRPMQVIYRSDLKNVNNVEKVYPANVGIGGAYAVASYEAVRKANTAWTGDDNLTFIGWADMTMPWPESESQLRSQLYLPGETITLIHPTTYLAAIYIKDKVDLIYHSNRNAIDADLGDTTSQSAIGASAIVAGYDDIQVANWPASPVSYNGDSYQFIGWNTQPDGTGAWYRPESVIRPITDRPIHLYAQWKEKLHHIVRFVPTRYAHNPTETQFAVEDGQTVAGAGGILEDLIPTGQAISGTSQSYYFLGWQSGEFPKADGYWSAQEAMNKAITQDTVFTAVWAAEPDPPKIIWVDEGDGSEDKKLPGERPVDLIRVYDGTAYHNPIELRTSGGADYGGSGASDPMPADGLLWTTDGRYFVAPFHRETQAQTQDGITTAADDDPGYYAFGLPSRTYVTASGTLDLAFVVMSRDANIYGSEEVPDVFLQITPRPLKPKAYFPDIKVGEPGPVFDDAYYKGLGDDGSGFAFAQSEAEAGILPKDAGDFVRKNVALYTPYEQGKPAGPYGIYARSGYYDITGNLVGEIRREDYEASTQGIALFAADDRVYVDDGNYAIDGDEERMLGSDRYVRVGSFNVAQDDTPRPSGGPPASPATEPPAEEEAGETSPGLFTDEHIKYIYGYPDGLIKPERALTRAEAAAVFFRILSEDYRAGAIRYANPFPDVEQGDWFNTEVSTLTDIGILKGYPSGNFLPNGRITRAELAAIAARFAAITGETGDIEAAFNDIAGHWAASDIVRAAAIGWVEGYPDRSFRPDEPIVRAEFVTIVNRMLERAPETADDLLDTMKTWPDNTPDKWYYLDMQEASNAHAYERKDKRVPDRKYNYETWTQLTETPDTAPNEP